MAFNKEDADPTVTTALSVQRATRTLTWDSRQSPDNSIIFELTWVGNETLILKEVTRAADRGSVVFFDVGSSSFLGNGRVVRILGEKGEEGDDGWIDSVSIVPNCFPLNSTETAILETISVSSARPRASIPCWPFCLS